MDKPFQIKIGELASLLQISPDTIRYYEKIGLLKPERNNTNNYRYYDYNAVERLMMIRQLLHLGLSTSEIANYFSHHTLQSNLDLMQHALNMINEQIVSLYKEKEHLVERITHIKTISQYPLEKVLLKEFGDRPCIMITNEGIPDEQVAYQALKFLSLNQRDMKSAFSINYYSLDCYTIDPDHSDPDSPYYNNKNVFYFTSAYDAITNYMLPGGKFLVLYYKGPYTKTKQLLPLIFEYAKSHHMTILSDPIEICHIDNFNTDDENEFFVELEVAVKSSSTAASP